MESIAKIGWNTFQCFQSFSPLGTRRDPNFHKSLASISISAHLLRFNYQHVTLISFSFLLFHYGQSGQARMHSRPHSSNEKITYTTMNPTMTMAKTRKWTTIVHNPEESRRHQTLCLLTSSTDPTWLIRTEKNNKWTFSVYPLDYIAHSATQFLFSFPSLRREFTARWARERARIFRIIVVLYETIWFCFFTSDVFFTLSFSPLYLR